MSSEVTPPGKHLVHVATARWGDREFFGGLAVAAVIVHRQAAVALEAMGLEEWRGAPARRLEALGRGVERVAPTERLLIEPDRYNKACKTSGGIADLMRWAHGQVVRGLLDRFPECRTVLCEPRDGRPLDGLGLAEGVLTMAPGEGFEGVAVSAAGAVARWLYSERRGTLEEKLGLCFDGDDCSIGQEIQRKLGRDMLYRIAKMDFPVGERILSGGGV